MSALFDSSDIDALGAGNNAPTGQDAPSGGAPFSPDLIAAISSPSAQQPINTDVLGSMNTGQRLLAGMGLGAAKIIHAATPNAFYNWTGLPDVSGPEAANLENTTAGKVGEITGQIGAIAPTMLIPGANTAIGASLVGAGTGALTTEGGPETRLKGAAAGAAGGLAGKYAGDILASGASALSNVVTGKIAQQQAQNQARDAAIGLARQHSYVMSPLDVNPTAYNAVLEGMSGKIKTAQTASMKNQTITNSLVKQEFGIPEELPITRNALQSVRDQAGQAYNTVRNTGVVTPGQGYFDALDKIASQSNGAAKSFPGLKNDDIQKVVDSLKQPQFAAGDAIDAIRVLRDSGDSAFSGGNKMLGKAYRQSAGVMEDALDQHMQDLGNPDALGVFRNARQTIAKTYSAEKALNPVTGNIDASVLGRQLTKGAPLSGNLKDIAHVALAFPKSTQLLKQNPNPLSPLDFAVGAISHPIGTLLSTARPLVRGAILSRPAQAVNAALGTNYGKVVSPVLKNIIAPTANSIALKDLLQLGGQIGAESATK